jgi:hypothetical protein
MALSDFQTLVSDLVRDDAGKISETQRDNAIAAAVARYSKDRPRPKVQDVTSAEGGNYLDLPEAWESDFSELQNLEYPIGEFPPSFVSSQAWSLYAAPEGLSIMVGYSFPQDAVIRVSFSIAHQVDSTEDTIPLGDREPVCCLAAANLCDQLAGLYSGDGDSTIQADSVDHRSKASEFSSRARALRKRYFDELGIDTNKTVAAGVVVDLDLQSSLGGERLTHGKTYRGTRRTR